MESYATSNEERSEVEIELELYAEGDVSSEDWTSETGQVRRMLHMGDGFLCNLLHALNGDGLH